MFYLLYILRKIAAFIVIYKWKKLTLKEVVMFLKAYKLIKTIKGVVDTAEVIVDAVKSAKDKRWNL